MLIGAAALVVNEKDFCRARLMTVTIGANVPEMAISTTSRRMTCGDVTGFLLV
jgi:hypothetical protein